MVDLRGKVLYLGSCASLRVSERRIDDLLQQTGAIAVCGYTKYVDWFESGAMDVMLLSALATATSGPRQTVRQALDRLHGRASDLLKTVGFVSRVPGRAG